MESLQLHIEYLLTRCDCVTVPGFGAFTVTETEASINLQQGVITPCRREISFNSKIVNDDKLLSHSIARRSRITYEEARQQLSVMTEKLRSDLRQEGEVSMGLVGRLLMDSEGYITFQPRSSRIQADILPTLPLSISSDSQKPATENPKPKTENRTPKTDNSNYYVFRIHKHVVHAAAILALILTIGVSMLIPSNHNSEQQKASVVPIPKMIAVPEIIEIPEILDIPDVIEIPQDSDSCVVADPERGDV